MWSGGGHLGGDCWTVTLLLFANIWEAKSTSDMTCQKLHNSSRYLQLPHICMSIAYQQMHAQGNFYYNQTADSCKILEVYMWPYARQFVNSVPTYSHLNWLTAAKGSQFPLRMAKWTPAASCSTLWNTSGNSRLPNLFFIDCLPTA